MRTLLVTCMLVALCGPRLALGQQVPTNPELKQMIDALRKEVDDLKVQRAALSANLLQVQNEKANLEANVNRLSKTVGDALAGTDQTLFARVAELSNQLKGIATKDGERYVLDIRSNMNDSSKFRKDFYDVTTATVEIQNETGRREELYVNGVWWRLPPGLSKINVPYGPVRIKFVYFSRDKAWTYKEKDWKHDGGRARLPLQIVSDLLEEGRS